DRFIQKPLSPVLPISYHHPSVCLNSSLSAFGMLAADVIKDYARTIMVSGDTSYETLTTMIEPMAQQGQTDVIAEGVDPSAITLEQLLDVRYRGQSYELTIPLISNFAEAFHTAHAQAYGYSDTTVPVEIVNLRLRAVGHLPQPPLTPSKVETVDSPTPSDHRPVVLTAGLQQVPFYQGALLQPDQEIVGPAIIMQPDTTIFLDNGDQLKVDLYRNLVIEVNKNEQ
ncbi:MAG: hypothetical protein AAF485_24730, partial [Chloroflexota bacterium]